MNNFIIILLASFFFQINCCFAMNPDDVELNDQINAIERTITNLPNNDLSVEYIIYLEKKLSELKENLRNMNDQKL